MNVLNLILKSNSLDSVSFCLHAKLLQLCLTLWDSMNHSPPGSSGHRILQARIPEWVDSLSFRGFSQHRDWTHISYVSCTGRWVLYHQCHLESPCVPLAKHKTYMSLQLLRPRVCVTVLLLVWIGELDNKEGWVSKNWSSWTAVLEKTPESPLDCKEINNQS